MAQGDFAAFLPSESAYSAPGEYETTQRSIAFEKATYQSNMDQFYKDLTERSREFDLDLDFQRENLSEQRREFDIGTETTRAGQREQARQFNEGLGFSREQLAEGAREFDVGLTESSRQFNVGMAENTRQFDVGANIEREKISSTENMFAQELGLKTREVSLQETLGMGQLSLQQQAQALESQRFDFTKDISSASFLEGVRQFNEDLALRYTLGEGQLSLEEQRQKHDETIDWLGVGSDALMLLDLLG